VILLISNRVKNIAPSATLAIDAKAKQLKKEGILLSKPTSYGKEGSINSAHREKIMHYINEFLVME